MVSNRTLALLSFCLIGGVVVSVSGNHMVLVNDDTNTPNVEQASRATIDAIPSGKSSKQILHISPNRARPLYVQRSISEPTFQTLSPRTNGEK